MLDRISELEGRYKVMRKRWLRNRAIHALLISVTLLFNISPHIPSHASGIPSEITGMQIDASDENDNTRPLSHIAVHTNGRSFLCKGINDPTCNGDEIGVTAYLQPCSMTVTLGCIRNVYAVSDTGTRTEAQFTRVIDQHDKDFDFEQSVERNLVAGSGVGSVWRIPGVVHGGGSDIYTVDALLGGSSFLGNPFSYDKVQIGIAAANEVPGAFSPMGFALSSDSSIAGIGSMGGGQYCEKSLAQDGRSCFLKSRMPSGFRFGIELSLPNPLSGWFHGRIFRPQIEIEVADKSSYIYRFEAEPVTVPILDDRLEQDSWSQEFKSYVNASWPIAHSGQLMPGSSGDLALGLASRYLPLIGDKATSTGDFWTVKTLGGWNNVEPRVFSCSADKQIVSGIVTTNAMVYKAGPPSFNSQTQTMDYKVLSPHYDEEGKENLGSYDLLLNSTVARCIYGFTTAPIRAEIEVLGGDGISKVATTLLGERGDWLFLSANGFTYSEPTVRVKLIQATPPASSEVDSTPVVKSKSSKKITITCKKGSNLKKITQAKPRCPRGFKRI